ncbi:MAG: hypothetical protein K6C10_10725, partial [Prevotella sp.]|nr:hypothetical protein [Prevotella sp.]
MKKALLSLTALLLSLGAMAQVSVLGSPLKFHVDPNNTPNKHHAKAAKAPAKAASLDNTVAWGYFMGDASEWGGLGVGASGVDFDAAIFVSGEGLLKGATLQGIKIPSIDAGMTNVKAWVRNSLTGSDLDVVDVPSPYTFGSYITVALNNPIKIPAEGLYVGYSFTGSEAYPIAIAGDMADGGLYLRFVSGGQDSGWGDYSTQFNPSVLQVLCSDVSLDEYSVSLNSVGTSYQLPSSEYTVPVNFVSNGSKAINSFDVDVTVNGTTTSQHVDLSAPIAAGFNQYGSFNVSGTSPSEVGAFDITVTLKKINGEAYNNETSATGSLRNLSKLVSRRTVIEEFTGTGCGYCPRGWVGMEYMKANYPDDFIGIAFHQYNSGDPLYYSAYPMLGLSGAPGCVIDRKIEADPYYGTGNDNLGIENDFKRLLAATAEVDVNVSAKWSEDMNQVNIKANVEFLTKTNGVSLVYVLTADSLTGTTNAWKQTNYYYQYSAAEVGNAPGLVDFCKGGKYGSSSVSLVFNDAVIGSSYVSKSNKGQSIGSSDINAGDVFKGTYTINSPSKTSVKNALNKNLVTAIVLVVDDVTGEILNAAKARVSQPGETITVDGAEVPVVKTFTVNHNEVEKTVYSGTTEEFDVNAVVEALGISAIGDAAQYIVNVTTNEAVANTTDGWRNASGDAETWGTSAGMVCVKINDPASGLIDYIGCIDDTHVAGETYTAKWAFVANNQAAVIDVVITFVEPEEVELEISENVQEASVDYETTEASYVEKQAVLTDDQVAAICAELGISALADATVYGYNPTTKELVSNYGAYDGWRNASGDFQNWSGTAEVPACVKYTDGKTYLCYNINGCEPQTIDCYWAIANDKKAVLVKVAFNYVVPAGISELNADEQNNVIYNLNGVRMQNTQQKGIY